MLEPHGVSPPQLRHSLILAHRDLYYREGYDSNRRGPLQLHGSSVVQAERTSVQSELIQKDLLFP